MIGHFTVMVNDKNDAVGCAIIRFQRKMYDGYVYKYHYFVCNYGYTNMRNEQVYEPGRAASKCKKTNPHFKGLCYTSADIENPNLASSLSHSLHILIVTIFISLLEYALNL